MPDLSSGVRSGSQEFEFSAKDFSRVRSMIYQRAGIALGEQKQEMVYGRLARRLRARGLDNFSAYLDDLAHNPDSEEWVAFTNALTTNLTSFFREAHHFPMLADYLKTCAAPINIWCAASSTGEEAWSIAITACEAFASLSPPVKILASDIDTQVLASAERAVYAEDRLSKMPAARVRQFFLKGKGANAGSVRLKPQVRQLVRFEQRNLLDSYWPNHGLFDVIFCRNVMIYFDKTTQTKILERFGSVMKPGGLLFAGHSENFLHLTRQFAFLGKTVYAYQGAVSARPQASRDVS